MQLDPLQVTLEELVNGRRFLLVFDDVWNEKQGDWDALLCPLRSGAKGSKILVTTRSGLVSSTVGTFSAHHLEGLSEDDCWSLIKHKALVAGSSDVPLEFEAIGKEIAKSCGGLPLAAKTLGSILRSKTTANEWDVISKTVLWELLPHNENEILQSLRLSYHHLPAHLKRCFSYCSVFPKDHEYSKEKLVLLWVAEGFVQPRGRQLMEDVGYEYFHDLLSMSFFQYSHDDAWDGQPRYKMHGLIHELAESIASENCCQMEDNQSFCKISAMVRHASLICRNSEPIDFSAFHKSENLRTLLLLCEYRVRIEHVPEHLFSKLRCLRTLDLSGTNLTELPDSIGNLKHLRLLDLFGTRIKMLPESTCSLYNLQTLNLKNCSLLLELPKNTKNLINLRHLTFDTYSQLMSMPPGIGKLTRLQSLSAFAVGKESGCGVQELKNLVDLQGAICIWRLENAVNVEEAKGASLKNKPRQQELTLGWSKEDDSELREERVEEGIIENLQPHSNLKELRIEHYSGVGFPSWIGDRSYRSLVAISFYGCKRCTLLPPLGQLPSLKYLFIDGMSSLKQVTREFYGEGDVKGFPALETLHLNDVSQLAEWCRVKEGEMGCIHQLTVSNCPKLGELPVLSFTLMKLYLRDCMGLNKLPMLPSLSDLELRNCDQKLLDSLPCFTSLSSLAISEIKRLKHLPSSFSLTWSSLKDLVIEGCHELISLFDENASCGFISLERLAISQCPQLVFVPGESLPTTLAYLQVSSCANLESLPDKLKKLTALQDLEIWDCPQIAALPEDGLPTALRYLDIRECPLLEERCQKGRGEDWHKIAHIPRMWIAYEQISHS
ncbi:hypothetical protein ACLOJK_028122 [Asimina triloba]